MTDRNVIDERIKMGVVYAPHRCTARPDELQQPVGSIWWCDECGRYSRKYGAHGGDWEFVRWYHFRARRLIKRLTQRNVIGDLRG